VSLYRLARPLLFSLDEENAHQLALYAAGVAGLFSAPVPRSPVRAMGIEFPNPIGLAAGLDKDAAHIDALAALGFGFVEVGTVTPRPQPGNPRPRLFRDPEERALINRMGFNNDGADAVAERIAAFDSVPLFVNIGKNKDTPLDAAPDDYAACATKLGPHANAIVINVSSPNTPSLRELQRPEALERILDAVRHERVFVKIAPDIDDAMLAEICDVCVKRASGMICTNTTITDAGGLSGAPLMAKSTEILGKVRVHVGRGYPLIGVGGIFTADDVRAKMAAGADLVQLYTGFIYEGPRLPSRLARELASLSPRA